MTVLVSEPEGSRWEGANRPLLRYLNCQTTRHCCLLQSQVALICNSTGEMLTETGGDVTVLASSGACLNMDVITQDW